MFRHCIYCCSDLGSNETVEEFPIGRRLAFDAARGRLWVVCRKCERWNLSPLEERWEAIERMEQLYRDTRLRVSGDQIGLARLTEGTELVRVGTPLRPEFAAWRYGDQFGRRRRRAFVAVGVGVGAAGALMAGALTAGFSIGMLGAGTGQIYRRIANGSPDKVIARIEGTDDTPLEVKRRQLDDLKLEGIGSRDEFRLSLELTRKPFGKRNVLEYTADDAVRVAAQLLPSVNRFGGNARTVQNAVAMLESAGDPSRTFAMAAKGNRYSKLVQLPAAVRLALEMAAHEERERRALEGELALLERAWRDAEEVAEIADRLLIPDAVTQALSRLRESVRR